MREGVTPERGRGRAPDGGALAAGPGRRIASAMRRGRTPALALVLAALALASVTAAASDPDDASIDDRSRERRRGARDGGAHPATVGEGSAGLVDVPFDAKPIRGVRGGEFPTAVPGGRARFLGGLEVTFTSPASSDETPELDADPLSYGGWSSATGNADGSVAWILTDNYARLMRVELRNEPRSGRLDGVAKIQDATNFRSDPPTAPPLASNERPGRASTPSPSRESPTRRTVTHRAVTRRPS